ncbi:MAG: hypothetical protein R3349_02260 [Geminicoccaceae bacterium]|nr:hypothetical protein [Geminicoccaceae bacterium]
MSGPLRRFAFACPTAFVVTGWDGEEPVRRLLRAGLVRPVGAPHDSDLLLLSGRMPETWAGALGALFDTLALPRLAVWLRPDREARAPEGLPLVELDPDHPDQDLIRERLLDPSASANHPILPDEPPSPWRGEGDHGQGGEGMMGGKPYGRPMAMVGNDPDGLMLGALSTSLGPFFPALPSGLQLKLTLQGERISSVDEVINWFPDCPADALETVDLTLRAAQGDEVPAAEIERARIRAHLCAMASILDLAGLPAVARRLYLADTEEPGRLKRLFRAAEWRGLHRVLTGVGVIDQDQAQELGLVGPAARASGTAEDARSRDSTYRDAGFAPTTTTGGDTWARWTVLRDECLQSASLILKLEERTTRAAEGPRGVWRKDGDGIAGASRANLAALGSVLPGQLWPDALLTIASLNLDMREAAIR